MITNKYSQTILSSNDLFDLLLQGKNISYLPVIKDEDIDLYNVYQDALLNQHVVFLEEQPDNITVEEFYTKSADEWVFPEKYQRMDVLSWLLNKCKTEQEIERVKEEYSLYESHDIVMILRLFIFLVDYMRDKKFIWGVGRGSSVSSYILYLIGIHRVNSLLYNLDINEYLK